MENQKNDWIMTDDDSFQFCRKVKDGVYELLQITSTLPSWEDQEQAFGVSHAFVDIKDADIADICSCYGYQSLEEIKDEYGSDWKQIIAECMFELDAMECLVAAPHMSYSEAQSLILQTMGRSAAEETHQERRNAENEKSDWIRTDSDDFQLCRKIKDDLYELYQVVCLKPYRDESEKAFGIATAIIDMKTVDIKDVCYRSAYPSLDKFKEDYGEAWERVIAEFAFEQDAVECAIKAPLMSYEEAQSRIVNTTGFREKDDSVNRLVADTPFGKLVAYPSNDPAHPGIYIDLHRDGEDADASLVLVEYTDDDADETSKIVTRVWGDTRKEDYTVAVDHEGIEEYFGQTGSI